ncbi:MAG: exodeoxyribonuclease V subunit beta [Gammaproteobacteria bacterium]|nr:exodeoxyribonuclease V subunit beta [Gammaproteobacteria bacterium]MBU2058584.1 exodeoxyribonuclease V subunit beta [Gammaproteobacteria bacterium]MBU2173536.1 exodeoxyribonuclease V subunit beta [Gammaproteobacteria bacterium]MBU2246490.1 exodeoxyribonuclease V subunit beta [Gammaproteobacteria bacterium]MBU2344838.1 exodeoxyribonuclease V subunit beta [Gammaproteobacteria bacterium]
MTTAPTIANLDLLSFPLSGSQLIEASAGTGKTFTIAALYLRLVLGHGCDKALLPPDILVVTFTEAATQELTERIGQRLADGARYFREQSEEADPFLQSLRCEFTAEQWPHCAYQLELAVQYLDEAAISTIHGWCNKVLAEFALSSGYLFEQNLVTDVEQLQLDVIRDYWRNFYYPLAEEHIATVWQLLQNPETLRKKILPLISHLALFTEPSPPAELLPEVKADRKQKLADLKAPWNNWVSEIRILLHGAIERKEVDGRKLQARYLDSWLAKLVAWISDPEMVDPDLQTGQSRLTPQGLSEAFKDKTPPNHPAFEAMEKLADELAALPDPEQDLVLHAAFWFARRFHQLQLERSELGFDELLSRLQQALQKDEAGLLAERLRRKFPLALIDEFQDTDPVQYQLFDAIYQLNQNRTDCGILLIGDPKQAIYAFRGADIYSYLAAKQATAGRHFQLPKNFRSTDEMVSAVNHLFRYAEQRALGAFVLGRPDLLSFYPVEAQGRKERFMVEQHQATALEFCIKGSPDGKVFSKAACLAEMAQACAEQIAVFLNGSVTGHTGFVKEGEFTALKTSDIAVLVNNQQEANAIKKALAERDLASVYLSDKGAVFESPVALDLLLWLRACAEPQREALVRSALSSWSLSLNYSKLEQLLQDELLWEQQLARFASYQQLWQQQGVLVMLWQLMRDFAVAEFLQQQPSGERLLTDILHLAELLQQRSMELEGPAALIRYLAEHLAGQGDLAAEQQKLRLESDEALIKIVTIHKSKGLEYPLVFLPFIALARAVDANKGPVTYHQDGELTVVLQANEQQAQQAERERLAEDMRKLYVALTRARHYCWVGLMPVKEQSAIGYLLSDDALVSPVALQEQLSPLLKQPDIRLADNLSEQRTQVAVMDQQGELLPYAQMNRSVKELWWIASYSALLEQHQQDSKAAELFQELQQELAPEQLQDDSEPVEPEALTIAQGFVRGSQAGTFLHDMLEWGAAQGFDLLAQQPDLWQQGLKPLMQKYGLLQQLPEDKWQIRYWAEQQTPYPEAEDLPSALVPVQQWLTQLIQTPLWQNSEASLSTLKEGSYRAELEFWLAVQHCSSMQLDALVQHYLWPELPRPALRTTQLQGMLKGFIDLTLEQDDRYWVLDYKSNYIANGQYDSHALIQQMLAHRYDVQAALYAVAIHRLLQSRLANYQPTEHLGGALYWFLRGGEATNKGVLAVDIPLELVNKLDALLQGQWVAKELANV